MKKILLVLFLLAGCFSLIAADDFGVGAAWIGDVQNSRLGSSFLLSVVAKGFFIEAGISGIGYNVLGVRAIIDYHIFNFGLTETLNAYIGAGGDVTLFPGDDTALGVFLRLPLGLQFWPAGRKVDIFLEVSPSIGFATGGGIFSIPEFRIPFGVGARYFF